MPDSQQILIVSDHAPDEITRATLEQRGFAVTLAQDFDTAYRQLRDSSFDLVIVDVARAKKGVEFVKRLRATPKLSKTFVLTIADWGTGQATLALTEGADAFEAKPGRRNASDRRGRETSAAESSQDRCRYKCDWWNRIL
jgi:DNA-binding response OmpR family regulator